MKFWDSRPPKEPRRYFPIQIECQNVALLQKIRIGVENSTIYVLPEPKTLREARANLYAFSCEGRLVQPFRHIPGAIKCTSAPLRECFGWMKVSGRELYELPKELRAPRDRIDGLEREFQPDQEYYALVYHFIPDSKLPHDLNIVQRQLDLFWSAGFCLPSLRPENWKDSLLLDMADLICPWHAGWSPKLYRRMNAKDWFGPACRKGHSSGWAEVDAPETQGSSGSDT